MKDIPVGSAPGGSYSCVPSCQGIAVPILTLFPLPNLTNRSSPYKSALLAARSSMVKWRIAAQSLLFCFDEFEDFFD
jgi:hypothetical protein